jgi:hypothetical protein
MYHVLGNITCISVSADGLLLATGAVDKALKVFDVVNFGEYTIFELLYLLPQIKF